MSWKYLDRIVLAVISFYTIWLNWRLDDLEKRFDGHTETYFANRSREFEKGE